MEEKKEVKENVNVFDNQNLVRFKKMYIGGAEGVSKKGNDYCMVKFLEINKYGNGDVVTLSVQSGHLPEICANLVCGDIVEVLVNVENIVDTPVLVDITKKIADSVIYTKKVN